MDVPCLLDEMFYMMIQINFFALFFIKINILNALDVPTKRNDQNINIRIREIIYQSKKQFAYNNNNLN